MKKVCIVVPCYQSEENIAELGAALNQLHSQLDQKYHLEAVLVDDGSSDGTYDELLKLKSAAAFPTAIVKLSGNFGSYNAFLAGLHHGEADAYIQLHSDMQDPPDQIPAMIDHWMNGYKLVIGQRVDREEKGPYRFFANSYHKMIKAIALPDIPEGGYDLILFDRQLRDEIVKMNENNVNLVYLISWLKYPYVTVPVVRRIRDKGKSQWTFWNRIKLVIDSVVAFSYFPIRVITFFSILTLASWVILTILAIAGAVHISFIQWFLLTLLSGLILSVSIIAEYLWRALETARKRPPFVVDKVIR